MAYFEYLRTFITVYREGSYGKAAALLSLTPQTVSNHITSLEGQLTGPLFIRRRKNVGKRYEPTDSAHQLASDLMPHIERIDEIFNASRKNTQGGSNIVRLGGLCELIENRLSVTITSLIPHNIQLNTDHKNENEAHSMLESKALDVAIVSRATPNEMVDFCQLETCPLLIVAAANAVRDSTMPSFMELPYISYKHPPGGVTRIINGLLRQHPYIQTCTQLDNFRMIKSLALQGTGFTILPQMLVRQELADGLLVQAASRDDPVSMHVYLAWNRAAIKKPSHALVRDMLADITQPRFSF